MGLGELKLGDLTSAFRALVTETVDSANRKNICHCLFGQRTRYTALSNTVAGLQ